MPLIKLTPTAGLYYTNTYSAWDLSSALTENSGLINGIKNDSVTTGLWYTAIGIDLGSSHKVTKLIFYDWNTRGQGLSAAWDVNSIYKSDDGTTWTLVETIDPLSRSGGGLNEIGVIEVVLTDPTTARYFCRYYSDPLRTDYIADPKIIGASEIEAYGESLEESPPLGPGIYNFRAQASGSASGILLSWQTGYGHLESTDKCKVTIQYSTEGILHNSPNTPPYVIRDLVQPQGANNILWHANTTHVDHYYSAWIYYEDTDRWYGPFNPTPTPTPPAVSGSVEPFVSGSLSFSKLDTNTKLSTRQDIIVDMIVWLPENQSAREPSIEAALQLVAPAHTKLNVLYERYYIAQTTTEHFSIADFDSNVHEVRNGMIINKKPTIDSSYSGNANILGESK